MSKIAKLEWLLLTLIILLSLTSQFFFIMPVTLSDEMIYYRAAVQFPRMTETPNHWTMRLGVVLPVAVLYRIFGHSEIAYYFLPISSTLLLTISTYLIGRMLFNPLIGLIASAWMSLLPHFLLESGNLLPDSTATACITTGILLILSMRADPGKKAGKWICLASGALFGWAYLAKEYFAVFALIVPIIFFIYKIPIKYLLLFSLGVVASISIEFAIHTLAYGNPLIRLSTSQPRETTAQIETDTLKIMRLFFIRMAGYRGAASSIITATGLISLGFMSFKRSKPHQVLFTWIMVVYIFFTLLGLLPVILKWENEVILRLHLFRYWMPLLPPLAIGCAAVWDSAIHKILSRRIKNHQKARIISSIFVILVFVAASTMGISAVKKNMKFVHTGSAHYQELRAYLANPSNANTEIWVVRDLKIGYEYVLPIYANKPLGKDIWNGQIKYLNTDGQFLDAGEITNGSVLIDRVHFNPQSYPIPQYLATPPDNWELAFESSNQRIALYHIH